jgi:hypothetical protein
VRPRLTRIGNLPAVITLLAVAVMGVASFLPYLQTPWPGTYVGVAATGLPLGTLPTASLAQGPGPFFALEILAALAVAAVASLFGFRRQFTGAASFACSFALVIAGIYPATTVGAPIAYGLYLFVGAALVASVAGLVMVVMSLRGTRLAIRTALPAGTCLLAVVVMGVASLLPYVQFEWTDGIFSYPSAGGPPSGPGPTANFAEGEYAVFLLMTLVVVGVAAATHLLGMQRRITAVVVFVFSLAALSFAWIYPATLGVGPVLMDYGLYLFAAAAAVSVIAGIVMVVLSFRGQRLHTRITGQSFAPNNVRGV